MLDFLQYEFMRNALMAGLLASLACGIIGALVVVKRISLVSGGISHAAFGGVGLGYLLDFDPLLGALFFALASSLGMGLMRGRTKVSEDSAIGILWVTGMSLGVLFIGLRAGYTPDLFSYLFGSILTVSRLDLAIMFVLDMVILLVVFTFYKELLALSFDEEFATVRGVPTRYVYLTLLSMVALTVVVLIRIVGVVLVIAMLTIPATIAWQFSHKLLRIMFGSTVLSVVFTTSGLWLSYVFNSASGATIVLVSVAAFILSSTLKSLR
ncbi:hypothetical protein CP083_02450 [Candidatus Bathyarchaeota archaeon B24-2]|nr:MAG: hypothetical protein CP083_02450 [Candidatus Bathyarchaeota archaeon B24-2]